MSFNDYGVDQKDVGVRIGVLQRIGVRLLPVMILVLMAAGGCQPNHNEPAHDAFILKCGPMSVYSTEFLEELELKKTAYSYDIQSFPDEYNEMVMEVVAMLSDELRFLRLASEKGIGISDQEVAQAEAAFKKDYPENSFEQLLLQNAISYTLWQKRFKRKLLMDKVIQAELADGVEVSASEIIDFYQDQKTAQTIDENELIKNLKMNKVQVRYDDWMAQLKDQYPVEMNHDLLKQEILVGLTIKKESQ
ncbi:MAG: hypothetical protein D3926_20375 [Desulfobacteraceae bacterium]|nr:MAG: hypothetical protein D3926_20375 [Desulfobacteraceae bacterium]